jgi:hypothetical protein
MARGVLSRLAHERAVGAFLDWDRSSSRPTMVRIQEISGGNPFYALELARTMGDAAKSCPRGQC